MAEKWQCYWKERCRAGSRVKNGTPPAAPDTHVHVHLQVSLQNHPHSSPSAVRITQGNVELKAAFMKATKGKCLYLRGARLVSK